LTRVSEGNDFRRLRVISKAGEVVEFAMLAHGNLHRNKRPIAARAFYHAPAPTQASQQTRTARHATAGSPERTAGGVSLRGSL
jgi:hypothetical protein